MTDLKASKEKGEDGKSSPFLDRLLFVEILPQYFDEAYEWMKSKNVDHSSYFMWSDCCARQPSSALIEFDNLSDALFAKLAFGGK